MKTKLRVARVALSLCAIVLLLAAVVLTACARGNDEDTAKRFQTEYPSFGKVGQSMEYLGTVERKLPQISDGGLERYPQYGVTLADATDEEKSAILSENTQLNASSSTYDSMDADGNLYLNGVATGGKLYKHTAAAGMYYGDVSDDEPALVKRITLNARKSGDHITGLYAPAGEVIKIEMSEEDFAATGGLTVYIGQVLSNGQPNNIWLQRDFNRMPVIVNAMTTKTATAYVGSFLGGPIYIKPVKAGTSFSVTISGGVAYPHFILGYTTEEEFAKNATSSAPYFDLEVWDDCVRHSGPKIYAQFDYDQLYDAAVLWDKISRVSNQIPSGSADVGIVFLYDPFVAAGAAVAFVGRNTVNCPPSWMTSALDYDSFVTNGSWGNIHEFNHHYQRYGFAPGDEVTNNAVSLISYSLYTKISAMRTEEGGLSGWNVYTDPSKALALTVSASDSGNANSALDSYANILHSFGQDAFIAAAAYGKGAGGADVWFQALCAATGYDMTYYFTELLHQTVSESVLEEIAGQNLPMYVPVASVYQTGVGFLADGERRYCETVQPFEIEYGQPYTLDLTKNIVLPDGFSYTIKQVGTPEYGTLKKEGEGCYVYTPDSAHALSGKFIVTLGIESENGIDVPDAQLVFELKQKQEKADLIERTTYVYTSETMYTSLTEAIESGYAGYESVTAGDNINSVQNGNAEVWLPTENTIVEISGKVYIPSDGKYRFIIRGRAQAAMYLSFDGENYFFAGSIENTTGDALFHTEDENTYSDYELKRGQYVYFKGVLLAETSKSYIGLGWGKFSGDSVAVTYITNAYRNSAVKEEFESEYYYSRNYTAAFGEKAEVGQTLMSAVYLPWDDSYGIENLFDENTENFIHSDKTPITSENPFEMTVRLDSETTANTFTVIGEPTRIYLPVSFVLYGGTEEGEWRILAEEENATVSNGNVSVTFPMTTIKYYKLVVTKTSAPNIQYIAFRRCEFSISYSGSLVSPDSDMIGYTGNWRTESAMATFGHTYIGQNAAVAFEFTGTQFAIVSADDSPSNALEVYIDGRQASLIDLRDGDKTVYLSSVLESGKHSVTLRGNSLQIDSFAFSFTEGGDDFIAAVSAPSEKISAATIVFIIVIPACCLLFTVFFVRFVLFRKKR